MTTDFPHTYRVSLSGRDPQKGCGVLDSDQAPQIVSGPPPQFEGTDTWWSPEQLLLGALATCQMTTFFAIARHKKLEVNDFECHTEGLLDKTADGLRFTSLTIRMDIDMAAPDCDKVERVVQATKKHCIVSNTLSVPVQVEATVRCSGDQVRTIAA
ncbi:MAG: OsmC family protein [Myxococcota bacterium]